MVPTAGRRVVPARYTLDGVLYKHGTSPSGGHYKVDAEAAQSPITYYNDYSTVSCPACRKLKATYSRTVECELADGPLEAGRTFGEKERLKMSQVDKKDKAEARGETKGEEKETKSGSARCKSF